MAEHVNRAKLSDLVLGHLSPEESLRLIDQMESDPESSSELEFYVEAANYAATSGAEVFGTVYTRAQRGQSPRGVEESLASWIPSWRPDRLVLAGALALVLCLFIFGAGWLLESRYAGLASVERPQFEVLVRSGQQEDVDIAYRLLNAGKREEALRLLERYVRAFPESEIADYAHYSAGAIHLMAAEKSFFWFFHMYDRERALAGMDHLRLAIDRSSNYRLIEESHWLRAKGYLMQEMPEEARGELQLVIGFDGLRKIDATRLLHEITHIR
jgi:tetratricopeptide (TPR) repeat protein